MFEFKGKADKAKTDFDESEAGQKVKDLKDKTKAEIDKLRKSSMAEKINVEVIYALANQQDIARVSLPKGSTATQAIEASGLLVKHPEIDLKKNKIGVFAKLAKADTVLRDRDRIEIYRPLIADPKEVRKQRAAEGKVMKKGAGDADQTPA